MPSGIDIGSLVYFDIEKRNQFWTVMFEVASWVYDTQSNDRYACFRSGSIVMVPFNKSNRTKEYMVDDAVYVEHESEWVAETKLLLMSPAIVAIYKQFNLI